MQRLYQSSTEVLKSAKEYLYKAKLDLDEADASLRQERKNVEVAIGLIQESPMLRLCLSSCVIGNKAFNKIPVLCPFLSPVPVYVEKSSKDLLNFTIRRI
uniref:Uncharacterized protein n=1 Tax=Ditylenchus dipsaci TaxID=166011 RepID=A0A915EWH5_9BILA